MNFAKLNKLLTEGQILDYYIYMASKWLNSETFPGPWAANWDVTVCETFDYVTQKKSWRSAT